MVRLRDRMARRGPDGAGVWRAPGGHVVLAHRRLAVIDPSPAGDQPMVSPDGLAALVYNGELYNDAELREALGGHGTEGGSAGFVSSCDTETVLRALRAWGAAGIDRLRGMYALAYYDAGSETVLLARDPLGIKPLYWWGGPMGGERVVVFASEPRAILEHPDVPRRPDLVGVSAYLTTIRTTLGVRTLFEGIRCVRPGEVLRIELRDDGPRVVSLRERALLRGVEGVRGEASAAVAERVRSAVVDSVGRHLRADVPTCCLLSGGLDSAIAAAVARRCTEELWTYCSGAAADNGGAAVRAVASRGTTFKAVAGCPSFDTARKAVPQGGAADGALQCDFDFARLMAASLGTRHTEAPVRREMFRERWPAMVHATGVPLSTPNEVAINEVARRLRADGRIVAISGEGADELFGGYDAPLTDAARFIASGAGCDAHRRPHPGVFQLDANAWIAPPVKETVLRPAVWRALERDAALVAFYRDEFEAVAAEGDSADPLQAHLRFHRRINLAGLLLRLDSATMLEGVEGRTPFADVAVAALAESLPMAAKFAPGAAGAATKRVLREAFAADLPPEVVARPKASFPLPFQEWMADSVGALDGSALVRELFTDEAIATVRADPSRLWHLAWPMLNVAVWARCWWG